MAKENIGSFDKDLDKITEREVVYDFVERLSLGKDLNLDYNGSSRKVFSKTLMFRNGMLAYMLNLLPPSLVFNFVGMKTYHLVINVGDTSKSVSFSGSYTLHRAYSDKMRMDISPAMTVSESGGNTTVTFNTDTPYIYNDIISIYVKKK